MAKLIIAATQPERVTWVADLSGERCRQVIRRRKRPRAKEGSGRRHKEIGCARLPVQDRDAQKRCSSEIVPQHFPNVLCVPRGGPALRPSLGIAETQFELHPSRGPDHGGQSLLPGSARLAASFLLNNGELRLSSAGTARPIMFKRASTRCLAGNTRVTIAVRPVKAPAPTSTSSPPPGTFEVEQYNTPYQVQVVSIHPNKAPQLVEQEPPPLSKRTSHLQPLRMLHYTEGTSLSQRIGIAFFHKQQRIPVGSYPTSTRDLLGEGLRETLRFIAQRR